MFAIKLMGGILLAIAGWCGGAAVCAKRTLRRKALGDTITLIKTLEEEISFRRTNLNSFYRTLAKGRTFSLLGIGQVASLSQCNVQGDAFQMLNPPVYFQPEEKEAFTACFSNLGHCCAAQECERLMRYHQQFKSFYLSAQQAEQQALALDRKIGLAIGSMLACVLI